MNFTEILKVFLLKAASGGNALNLSVSLMFIFLVMIFHVFREIEISFDCLINFYYSEKMVKIGSNVSFSLQENS